ncbi:MAG: ABC transporter ATP-binding protein [Pseudomonadota bacterium]
MISTSGLRDVSMKEYDIVLENVTKRFGEIVAVDNVSLTIETGEFISFIGPSGCGKTTTLRLIAGLETQDSGEIYIRGKLMDEVPPYERNLAMVFQSFAIFPHMNVWKNLEFGLKMRKVDKGQRERGIMDALDIVGLQNVAHSPVTRMSFGQLQRVALARALVVRPQMLLLDEPLGSLDASLRARMQGELKSLQKRLGISFIHVTHDQSEAMAMADRIVVMNEGIIEQIGTPSGVYGHPEKRFVAEFVGRNNIFEGVIAKKLSGDQIIVRTELGEFLVHSSESSKQIGEPIVLVLKAEDLMPRKGGDCKETYDNLIEGVVKDVFLEGSLSTCILELPNGKEMQVEEQAHLREHLPSRGERMTVYWDPRHVHIIP